MKYHPIAVAMPFLIAFIVFEVVYTWYRGLNTYRFGVFVADLSAAMVQRTSTLVTGAFLLAPYVWLYHNARLFEFDNRSAVMHVMAFLIYDFMYYLWHRVTHTTTLGWATHAVHHQSEDYNLAMGLRLPMLTTVMIAPFYLPLAILGVPPEILVLHTSFNALYQFFLHLKDMPKLGPLEWIFATPSAHRAHHATNGCYVDRNYAGVLVIWDRMLGTFVPEEEEPVFGVMDPVRSFDPMWANLYAFRFVYENVTLAPTWRDAWRGLWINPAVTPPWVPARTKVQPPTRAAQERYDPTVPVGVSLYVAAHFMTAVATVMLLLLWYKTASFAVLAGLFAFLFVSTSAWNALTQSRAWALRFEQVRLVVFGLGGAAAFYSYGQGAAAVAVLGVAVACLPAVTWAVRAGQVELAALGGQVVSA